MAQISQPNSASGESVHCSASECWQALEILRSQCPLVQCITNYVSMDIMANTLLAIGASPAMAHGEQFAVVLSYHHSVSLHVVLGWSMGSSCHTGNVC